jgi:hypothetical protein
MEGVGYWFVLADDKMSRNPKVFVGVSEKGRYKPPILLA